MLDPALERLAEVLLGELVLQRGEGAPAARVLLLRLVLLGGGLELGVAQEPAEARGRVAVPGLAVEGLNLREEGEEKKKGIITRVFIRVFTSYSTTLAVTLQCVRLRAMVLQWDLV